MPVANLNTRLCLFAAFICAVLVVLAVGVGQGVGRNVIVFGSRRFSGEWELYMLDINVNVLHQLTNSPVSAVPLAWSRQGDQIAVQLFRDGEVEMDVVDVYENDVWHLTAGHRWAGNLNWSPDGGYMAFMLQSSIDNSRSVHIVDSDSGNSHQLTDLFEDTGSYSWLPDSSGIVFEGIRDETSGIYVVNATDASVRDLYLSDQRATEFILRPALSPNGAQIVFISPYRGENSIYVMNADGTDVHLLTEEATVPWTPQGFVWSPDGSRLAFISRRVGDSGIYLINVDGSNLRKIGDGLAPVWSPDGTQVAFTAFVDTKQEIYAMNVNTGELRNLSNHPDDDCCVIWKP